MSKERRRKTYRAPPLRGMRFDAPFLRRENWYRRVYIRARVRVCVCMCEPGRGYATIACGA